jgi:2-phosphosulfolactate phosphatase
MTGRRGKIRVIDVVPTAEAVRTGGLTSSTALVIDVLRASTTIIAALANGCAGIRPVAEPEEARQRAGERGWQGALVAGERDGDPLGGFDLGNSPLEFVPERVRDKIVIFTTTNGTHALLAARPAAAVGIAALVNLSAAAAWARDTGRDVTLVCAGDLGSVSLEDYVCAGLLATRLATAEPAATLTAVAADAVKVSHPYAQALDRLRWESPWARRLMAAGRGEDVTACLRLDTTTLVPILHGTDMIVAARGGC